MRSSTSISSPGELVKWSRHWRRSRRRRRKRMLRKPNVRWKKRKRKVSYSTSWTPSRAGQTRKKIASVEACVTSYVVRNRIRWRKRRRIWGCSESSWKKWKKVWPISRRTWAITWNVQNLKPLCPLNDPSRLKIFHQRIQVNPGFVHSRNRFNIILKYRMIDFQKKSCCASYSFRLGPRGPTRTLSLWPWRVFQIVIIIIIIHYYFSGIVGMTGNAVAFRGPRRPRVFGFARFCWSRHHGDRTRCRNQWGTVFRTSCQRGGPKIVATLLTIMQPFQAGMRFRNDVLLSRQKACVLKSCLLIFWNIKNSNCYASLCWYQWNQKSWPHSSSNYYISISLHYITRTPVQMPLTPKVTSGASTMTCYTEILAHRPSIQASFTISRVRSKSIISYAAAQM